MPADYPLTVAIRDLDPDELRSALEDAWEAADTQPSPRLAAFFRALAGELTRPGPLDRADPFPIALKELDADELRDLLTVAKHGAVTTDSPGLRRLHTATAAHLLHESHRRDRALALFALDLDDDHSAGELVADLEAGIEAARREFSESIRSQPPSS